MHDWRATYVGKNELNEHALRWKFCIKQNSQVRLSLQACLRPSIILTFSPASPTRSRSMRSWAIWRSSGVNQEVVRGVLGSKKKPKMATNAVTAPSLTHVSHDRRFLMNRHLHDEQPSPTSDTSESVHASKYASSNQAREARCQDLRTIQQGNPRSNLCFPVSHHIIFKGAHSTYLSLYKRYSTYMLRQDRMALQ